MIKSRRFTGDILTIITMLYLTICGYLYWRIYQNNNENKTLNVSSTAISTINNTSALTSSQIIHINQSNTDDWKPVEDFDWEKYSIAIPPSLQRVSGLDGKESSYFNPQHSGCLIGISGPDAAIHGGFNDINQGEITIDRFMIHYIDSPKPSFASKSIINLHNDLSAYVYRFYTPRENSSFDALHTEVYIPIKKTEYINEFAEYEYEYFVFSASCQGTFKISDINPIESDLFAIVSTFDSDIR